MFFQQRPAANATLSYFFGCAGHGKAIAVYSGGPELAKRAGAAYCLHESNRFREAVQPHAVAARVNSCAR